MDARGPTDVARSRRWPGLVHRLGLATLLASTAAFASPRQEVNVYAWAEYFPAAFVRRFEAETGIKVNVTVMDSNDVVETTLAAGHSGFDVVTINASPHLAREIPRGLWQPLDRTKLPHFRHADPDILRTLGRADPGNRYAVPWMWGTTGVIYDPERLREAGLDGTHHALDLVFDPAVAHQVERCGISVLDAWVDVLPMLANWLGEAELSTDPKVLDRVASAFMRVRPELRRVTSSGYYQQLAEGELCVSLGYSGDAAVGRRMIREAGTHRSLDYAYPDGRVYVFVDTLAIPADAPHVESAHRFIDFAMRPENAASVAAFIGFATGNADAIPLLDVAMQQNHGIYPPPEVRARLRLTPVYTPEESRIFGRAWLRMKAGQYRSAAP